MPTVQEPVSFAVAGVPVRGILYSPEGRKALAGVVICDPFAEEKKCAQSTLAQLGRALAEADACALHFDYRGTGDSGGRFEDYSVDDYREDLRAAVDFLRLRTGAGPIGLLGLRLGATLAALEAPGCRAGFLIMWEPILDGARYLRELSQRSTIKGMLTGAGPAGGLEEEGEPVGFVDLDGYRLSPRAVKGLQQLRLEPAPGTSALRTLLIECTPRGENTAAGQALIQSYRQGEARALRLEPFWQRIGLTDTSALIAETVSWLQQQWGGHA